MTLFGGLDNVADSRGPLLSAPIAEPHSDWPHLTWRFARGGGIDYRYPEPLTTPPPALRGGVWHWNQLIPDWTVSYPTPPYSLAPRGETCDQHGPRMLPPAGFAAYNARKHPGCPHCRRSRSFLLVWGAWANAAIDDAVETARANGLHCYGFTELAVEGLGDIQPNNHHTRWSAGYCATCGAITWRDFREAGPAHYFHRPLPA